MSTNFVIGVSDYIISGCDFIITDTDFIITTTDYKICRHSDVFLLMSISFLVARKYYFLYLRA